jgi:hypothetical protein
MRTVSSLNPVTPLERVPCKRRCYESVEQVGAGVSELAANVSLRDRVC